LKGHKNAKYYVLGWSGMIISLVIFLLTINGVLPFNLFTHKALYFGISLEILMFSVALGDRLNTMKKEKEFAQEQNIELVTKQNVMLEQKVKERTNELEQQNEEILTQKNNLQDVNNLLNEKNIQITEQKEKIQNNLLDLKNAQAQLIQSEKMASLGKLIAGVAHEVNTPLGAIKSSADEIAIAYHQNLKELPEILRNLDKEQFKEFLKLLNIANTSSENLSTREERQIKRNLYEILEKYSFENPDYFASRLVQIGIVELTEDEILFLKKNNPEQIISSLYNLAIQYKNNENVRLAANKASRVILALKNYSRSEVDGKMLPIDIAKSIDIVLTIYQNQLKKGITVVKNFEDIKEIQGFPDKLNQVWTNIIQNAVQAMKYVGTLTIGITENEAKNKITVSFGDTGCGIPFEIQEKIFEPFFTTKAAGEGSGLGLDIVKKIIEEHNGKIYIKSEIGVGSTFFIDLPINYN